MSGPATKRPARPRVLGYGVCGPNERYLTATLDEFRRLCDEVVVCLCQADAATEATVRSYGFHVVRDDREWGTSQHLIKGEFVASLAAYSPEWLICLDMDETFDPEFTRDDFDRYAALCDAMYVYIVNLWDDGWNRQWSFWNVRAWKWNGVTEFENRPLHCGLAPKWAYHYGSNVPVALIHSGLKERADRLRKVERYRRYDPRARYRDKSYYDALESGVAAPLDMAYVRAELRKEITSVTRKRNTSVTQEYARVRRQDGKVLEIPAQALHEHVLRGFTPVS